MLRIVWICDLSYKPRRMLRIVWIFDPYYDDHFALSGSFDPFRTLSQALIRTFPVLIPLVVNERVKANASIVFE